MQESVKHNSKTEGGLPAPLLLGLMFISFAILSVFFQIQSASDSKALAANGVNIDARTTGASTKYKNGSKYHTLKFSYEVDGKTYRKSSSVPNEIFDKYASEFIFFEQDIPIRYLPKDPEVHELRDLARIKKDGGVNWLGILLPFAFALTGLVFLAESQKLRSIIAFFRATKKSVVDFNFRTVLQRSKSRNTTMVLRELKKLEEDGIISSSDFDRKKEDILNKM